MVTKAVTELGGGLWSGHQRPSSRGMQSGQSDDTPLTAGGRREGSVLISTPWGLASSCLTLGDAFSLQLQAPTVFSWFPSNTCDDRHLLKARGLGSNPHETLLSHSKPLLRAAMKLIKTPRQLRRRPDGLQRLPPVSRGRLRPSLVPHDCPSQASANGLGILTGVTGTRSEQL